VLRRALAVAFAAAGLALVPATASATPEPAPVENYSGTSFSASTQAVLFDGRTVRISLGENRSAGLDSRASLFVTTFRQSSCPWGPCQTEFAATSVELSAAQLDFDGGLSGVSVTDVPVTFVRYVFDPATYAYSPVEETLSLSVVLTGAGPVARSASHGPVCGDGSRECQAIRVEASRAAVSEITFGTETVTGEGSLFRGHWVDAAAPKFVYDGS
jgi:hypothetical protein